MEAVGLTGGIASGKSFIVSYLKKINISVHESDVVIRALYEKPTNNLLCFLEKEGFEKSLNKKKINKKIIRDLIFNNKNKKKKIEKYLHNAVRKSRENFLIKNKNKKIVFLDIPLLFENKLEKNYSFICTAICSLKTRKARALQRPGMTKKILNQIVRSQTNDNVRKKKSDYLINTTQTKTKTCLQVDKIIYDILQNIGTK